MTVVLFMVQFQKMTDGFHPPAFKAAGPHRYKKCAGKVLYLVPLVLLGFVCTMGHQLSPKHSNTHTIQFGINL